MKRGTIYCITCLPPEKWYFGQTIADINKRWYQHLKSAERGCNYKLSRAIRKYGSKNFTIEEVILVEASSLQALKAKLDFLERHFIQKYDTRRNGYNMTDGGEGVLNPSDEVRKKISEAAKRRIPSMKGKHHSELTKRKMSQTKKGKVFSRKHKKRLSKSHIGVPLSRETRKKMSESRILFNLKKRK